MDKKIYVDHDGCLAVWREALSERQLHEPAFYEAAQPDVSIMKKIRALQYCGFDVAILTKVMSYDIALAKSRWYAKNGVTVPVTYVPYNERKEEYVDKDQINILIDDYTPNLMAWEAASPSNIGIKYRNGVNGTKGRWKGLSFDASTSIADFLCMIETAAPTHTERAERVQIIAEFAWKANPTVLQLHALCQRHAQACYRHASPEQVRAAEEEMLRQVLAGN